MDGNKHSYNTQGLGELAKKWFDILITQGAKTYTQSFDLDKTYTHLIGITVTSNRDTLLFTRGSHKIELNRQELFPEGYEAKMLMSTVNVPVNQRYYDTRRIPTGNGVLKITYTDSEDATAPFEPYRVRFYLDCEIANPL